jgi:periplasmic divalent cation tolerance protein
MEGRLVRWEPERAQFTAEGVKGEFPPCAPPRAANRDGVLIAWTTVSLRPDAERLAAAAIAQNRAVCVQIEGPITSHYRWQGREERSDEFRLHFKCLESQLAGLEELVLGQHPYDIPEWVVIRAERVAEKYLSWARANSSSPPL